MERKLKKSMETQFTKEIGSGNIQTKQTEAIYSTSSQIIKIKINI